MISQKNRFVSADRFVVWQGDPFAFIKDNWGIDSQIKGEPFEKGQMITWQQAEIVQAVKDAVNGKGRNKISVRSGKGVGKSSIISMLILWFVFCYKPCKIPCTAPTEAHLQTVLWNEISLWLNRMPQFMRDCYEITSDKVYIKQNKDTQFAIAKVGKKESAEGIAGIHSDYILCVVDEASGVADEIFMALQGIFSSGNVIMLLISNPTRLTGYFHDSHNTGLRNTFKCIHLNGEESPIVDKQLLNDVIARWGKDSEQYRIDVLGEFPTADNVDKKGYMKLLRPEDIKYLKDDEVIPFGGDAVLGIDPAGEGSDETVWVLRDNIKSAIIKRESKSTPKGIAQTTATIMLQYNIPAHRVIVDNFGVGADCIQELAMMGYRVYGLYLGKEAGDKKTFLNKRAELYWRGREWLKKGGMLENQKGWDELLNIYFRRQESSNKIQIMDKMTMREDYGLKSPNIADAFVYTFMIPQTEGGGGDSYTPDFGLDPRRSPVITNDFSSLL